MQTVQEPQRARKQPRRDLRKLMSTRRGTVLVAGVSALLAAAVLMVFLNQYRNSLNGGDDPATVLVAKSLIEKGSSGTVIAEKTIFQTARVKKSELKNGALADPTNLRGKVAADDIYPGEQLVIGDFAEATGGIRDRIGGDERAIALPLDAAHGLIGDVQSGDHVDVHVVFRAAGATGVGDNRSILKTLIQDTIVLRAPKKPKQGSGGPLNTQEVVLRATDSQAAELAFASDNGKIWIVLRPKIGSKQSKPSFITEQKVLLDLKNDEIKRLQRAGRQEFDRLTRRTP
jgi:Flp pilus assembly protein CpaB